MPCRDGRPRPSSWAKPPFFQPRHPGRPATGELRSPGQPRAAVPTWFSLYDVFVHLLAEQLLAHTRRHELLKPGDRVGVAVSGGIDSVALLRLLLELRFELGIVLWVVHFNHKLRGAESDADEEFVGNLAREHDLEFHVDRAEVAAHAREKGLSVETAARELRYGFFFALIRGASAQEVTPSDLSQNARERWGNRQTEFPSGAKAPESPVTPYGMAEAVPFPNTLRRAAESRAPSIQLKLDKIATGHTLDDQAETVLMRIIRGAGMRGLSAIYPRIQVDNEIGEHCGEIVRPLLETRRCELEAYLNGLGQSWREDATNADHRFVRNRVRKLLMPLLEKEFNPSIAQSLTELAEIAREEEDYWQNEIAGWMGTAVHWGKPDELENPHPVAKPATRVGQPELVQIQPPPSGLDAISKSRRSLFHSASSSGINASVDRLWFLSEPIAVQRRLLKALGDNAGISLEYNHVEGILRLAAQGGPSGQELSLPSGWKFVRDAERLIFVTPDLCQPAARHYEYLLAVPGTVLVHELGLQFETQIVSADEYARYNRDDLLDLKSLPAPLRLRTWRPGDRFWPAHTKSPKKIKELLQKRHASENDRPLWPVVQSGNEIVWMRGFAVPMRYQAKPGQEALRIVEATVSGTPEQ
jgi:tRNA(Ile)-lysidine synthase